MGFSPNLQARVAHDALIARQDAEIRLLENIKRCLANKVKCDKEYALALSSVATQGQKLEKCEELADSVVFGAWRALCSEWEAKARRLRRGAEALEARALERLSSLGAERRKARKLAQEDANRVSQHFTQLSEDVTRKQSEYQKYLEIYKQMRSKFEEHYIKSPTGRGGRKLEEMRDKYQKACRKLHLTHNEYVLLLAAATECEKDLRTVQLPATVARQKAAQEVFIIAWRSLLLDIAQNSDVNTEQCRESQKNIETTIQNIKPVDEYKSFNDKLITPPSEAITFAFDPSLVEDTSGKLQANQLTVDNLTVEWLKNKLQELETNIQENKEKQTSLQGPEIITLNGTLKNSNNGGSPISNGSRVNGCSPEPGNRNTSSTPETPTAPEGGKELAELRCNERQWTKQAEMLRQALSELGCEEAPAAWPEPATPPNASPPRSPANEDRQGDGSSIASTTSNKFRRHLASVFPQRKFFKSIGRPFVRRKSAPCSPVAPPKLRSQRGGSEGPSGVSNVSVKPKLRAIRKKRLLLRKRYDSSLSNLCAVEENDGVASYTLTHDSNQLYSGDNISVSSTNSSECSGPIYSVLQPSTRPLVDEEWFHGVLPREEVVRLLKVDGDFLVRETTRNDECQTVLSVCWGGHKHFIVQTTPEAHYRFEGPAFPSVRELILYQQNSGLAVTGRSGAILRRPIPRERWELNNDDIVLMEKIGRGNFGDVYKAQLKTSKQEVAVKTCRMTLPDEQKRTFLQEGRILKQYDHPNIVRLIGICVQKQPIMIVMELVSGGSLLTFLRTRVSTLTQKPLLGMCRDAAAGMRYLESKNCIHRDLAARNCLVGKDHIVKISDFGMSREEEEYIVSGGMKQIPIKWTAPEALNFGKYTSLCDVWSYGILMWEIFAKGDTPYSGMSNSKAREKIDGGYRMPSPEGCPEDMYRLMLRCWEYDPELRPHFDQIYTAVDALYSDMR